jgi:hypothetical protein
MAAGKALRISHFRVEDQLQRDELGYFFRAVDEQLDRPVVLRVVRAGQVENGGAPGPMRQRIRAQARAAATVSHPNLVTIYEFRSLAETDIVVMELVEGRTLQELRNAGRRWTVVEMARLLARVGDALATAHEAGLVHGNVNAANVRIRPDGRFKLLDLGIPKIDTIDDHVPHDPSDDVRGLARMACELLGPPIDIVADGDGEPDLLVDPTAARAHYGFLAPVLKTALRDSRGYANGAALRDAVLQALEMASGKSSRGSDIDRGFSTHVLGPRAAASVAEDSLPAEIPVFESISQGRRGGGPRLVLPADLAERAPPDDTFDPNAIHLTLRPPSWVHKAGRMLGPRAVIALVLVGAVAIAAIFVLYRVSTRSPASAATLDPNLAAAEGEVAPPSMTDPGVPADSLSADPALAGGDDGRVAPIGDSVPAGEEEATTTAPVFTAPVRVSPAGARIRALDGSGEWTGDAEIGVSAGDTLLLELSRPGYVSQRHEFVGRRISVALQPDSVIASFRANVSADVFLAGGSGDTRIGTTNVDVRLPTGRHRIVFRSPGQEDWETTVSMTTPGQTYPVSKTDFVTVGSLMASAAPTWATVSVDGGLPRETPARFDDLAVGRHVVTVTREGFETIVDTVLVSAGGTIRRNYTLRQRQESR